MATEVSGTWSKVFSEEHKAFYYYNSATQESTWTQPPDWNPQPVQPVQAAGYGGQGGYGAYGAAAGAAGYGYGATAGAAGDTAPAKCFVGGLAYETTEQSLGEFCSSVGRVVDVKIIKERDTGRCKGYGFVTYASGAEAQRAINELDGKTLDGRAVRINDADKKGSSSSSSGSAGGSGGGDSSNSSSGGRHGSPRSSSSSERRRSRSRSRDRGDKGRSDDPLQDLRDVRGKRSEDKGFTQQNFESSGSIYVSGLPTNITTEALVKTFSMIGRIKMQKVGRNRWDTAPKIKIYEDPATRQPKGDAVIHYEDPSSAAAAPKFFHDQEVEIHGLGKFKIQCQVNAKKDPPPGGGGGGNRGGGRGGYGGRGGGGGGGGRGGRSSGGGGGGGGTRPGDWPCPACNANNFASKSACFKCGVPKPGGGGGGGGFSGGGGGGTRPGDWPCPACNANNFASKSACFKCGVPKPGGAGRGGGGGGGGGGYGGYGGGGYGGARY